MTDFDYEKEVAIDLDNLHEEWRSHAQTRKKYADEVTHLEKVKAKADENVKVTRSRLIKEIKSNPALSRQLTSDALREAHYRTHPDHEKAKDELIEAEYNLGMAWNALRSFDDRKFGLENEVKLWMANYFATPTERRDVEPGKRIMESAKSEIVKKSRKEVNQRRRRKP